MTVLLPTDAEGLRLQTAGYGGQAPESQFLEIRPIAPGGGAAPGRAFIPHRDHAALARQVAALTPKSDVYIGAVPRTERRGTADALGEAWVLWADLDDPAALERLRCFRPRPAMINLTSAGRAQAKWWLRTPLPPDQAQRANRRLALALAGDMNATDPARVLRAIGSLNFKREPHPRVRCVRAELDLFTAAQVVGGLPDADHYKPRAPRPSVTPYRAAGDPSRALAGLVRTVADAQEGARNDALLWATCRAAEHVVAGEMVEGEAIEQLHAAALHAGLGDVEITATIRSGFRLSGRAAA